MKSIFVLFFIFLFSFIFVRRSEAIVFLPALLLIPIAKIVALVIGGLSVPALGFGTLWYKLYKSSPRKIILILFLALLLIGTLLAVFLKITSPERPLI